MKDILDGTYKANDTVNEKTLMGKCNVSKTSVKGALVQFCDEGVLNNVPRFGYQLTMILPSRVIRIVEYRKIIELEVLEMSFLRLTRENFDQLKVLSKDAGRITCTEGSHIHWETSIQFHKTLCSFCDNIFIRRSLSDALNICTRISNQYFIQIWNNNQISDGRDHIRLVETVEEGNLRQAREMLADDMKAFKDEIL